MSFRHAKLGQALGWKFNYQSGMSTSDGSLIGWPTQTWPTDQELAQWVSEYEAYLTSAQCKDDELQGWMETNGGKAVKALALVGIQKGLWTLAELQQKYRSL